MKKIQSYYVLVLVLVLVSLFVCLCSSVAQPANGPFPTPVGWTEPTTYYVSPTSLGSDGNSGKSRAQPLQTYIQAANLAYSNAPATIVLMAGSYVFAGTNNSLNDDFLIPPFVNVIGEASNNVVISNTNTSGNLGTPAMQVCGTNQITGVNFTFNSSITTDVPLGNFGGTSGSFLPLNYASVLFPGTGVPPSISEVYFKDCAFSFQGTGIHFEAAGAPTLFNWDFNRCKFLCNNNFIQMRIPGALITVENSDVTLRNWTNVTVFNNKPFRMFETRTVPNVFSNNFPVRISNTQFHYSDADSSNSNRPVFLCWNTLNTTNTFVATNIFQLNNCSFEALSITNPASLDFPPTAYNAQTQCVVTMNAGTYRLDSGGPFTTATGYFIQSIAQGFINLGVGSFSSSSTNTLVVNATGLTNNTLQNYLVSVTGGTGLSVKDASGTQFLVPVLGDAFPLKPGWRFTGTAVTGGIAVQFP